MLPAHGATVVTAAVSRSSAGAVEHLPVAVVPNLARYLAEVKGDRLWAYAAAADGETAVFLVSSASSTTGEGNCEPDDTCTFLYMKAGEQQSFESVDGNDQVVTYVLKMLQVNMEKTDAPQDASSSKASSLSTRRALREGFSRRIGAIGF